jgi:hemin uptake protein HemP
MTPAKPLKDLAKKVASEALLGARRELIIVHNGREYRLRVTQNGKLILTA